MIPGSIFSAGRLANIVKPQMEAKSSPSLETDVQEAALKDFTNILLVQRF